MTGKNRRHYHCKALNSLLCADVPLRNYSLTHADLPRKSRSVPQAQISPTDPEHPRRSAPQVQICPVGPNQPRRCATQAYVNIFISPTDPEPSAPHIRTSSPDPSPQVRTSLQAYVNVFIQIQSHISPVGTDPPHRLMSIFRQISNFIINSASLDLLTYYRSAPHFHLRLDLPCRSAPPLKFYQP